MIETIPYLSADALAGLKLTSRDVIACIEGAIAQRAAGTAWSAPKAVIFPGDGRYLMAALAAQDDPSILAVKTVVLNPENTSNELPQINGLVTVLNSQTGIPVAIIDGNWITAVRTAGLSAVAAKYMARKNSAVIAFIGCGVQAHSHLRAFADQFPLSEVRIFGRGQKNIDSLCDLAKSLSLKITHCASGREAVSGADLIVTSITYSAESTPFLDAGWLDPGAFAAITDLGTPWIDESFTSFNQVVIDDRQQEAVMPNKLVDPELIGGDLSELVLGEISGRSSTADKNAFIFRGHALGDLALASLVLQKAGIDC